MPNKKYTFKFFAEDLQNFPKVAKICQIWSHWRVEKSACENDGQRKRVSERGIKRERKREE